MKKTIFITVLMIILCLVLVGCEKKEDEEKTVDNSWEFKASGAESMFDEVLEKAFEDYTSEKLKPIAILGKQIVAGTNYMFLCEAEKTYKFAVVYKDLEGKAQVTQVNKFDVKKYVNEDFGLEAEMLSGGWSTEVPGKPIMLEEKIQEAFDKATERLMGVSYYPIAVLAEQEKSGTNYAVMCYGRLSDQNATTGIFVLTLYIDKTDKPEVVSIAAVDLKDYNK